MQQQLEISIWILKKTHTLFLSFSLVEFFSLVIIILLFYPFERCVSFLVFLTITILTRTTTSKIMGCVSTKKKLSKADLEFLEENTEFTKDQIIEWYEGFIVSTKRRKNQKSILMPTNEWERERARKKNPSSSSYIHIKQSYGSSALWNCFSCLRLSWQLANVRIHSGLTSSYSRFLAHCALYFSDDRTRKAKYQANDGRKTSLSGFLELFQFSAFEEIFFVLFLFFLLSCNRYCWSIDDDNNKRERLQWTSQLSEHTLNLFFFLLLVKFEDRDIWEK